MKLREAFLEGWTDKIKGGLADKKNPQDFDQQTLMQGIHIELEHTGDIMIAMEIAMDHLAEDLDYYDKLAQAGI